MLDFKILKKVGPLIAGPILRRAGTMLAVYLASQGLGPDKVDQVIGALAIIGGVVLDLAADWYAKRENKAAGYRAAIDSLDNLTTGKP